MKSDTPEKKRPFEFGDVAVDADNFSVFKNGEIVTLTPKAFDVLTYLMSNDKRVVEKSELFEQVWKETFVSDNALTKIIKEIRQSIGDDAGNPRYIETVPKRGYKFIAEVKTVAPKQAANSIGRLVSGDNRHTRGRTLWAVGTVLAGLLLIVPVVFYLRNSPSVSKNTPIDSIAVLPIQNIVLDENLEYLSDGITDNIINTLSRLDNLRVLSRQAVFAYKNKQVDPITAGRELGAGAVLSGRMIHFDDKLVIQVSLIDVARKTELWKQDYFYKFAEVLPSQNTISHEVVDNLRLNLTETQEHKLADREPQNPEAQRAYLSGLYLLNRVAAVGPINDKAAYDKKRATCQQSIDQFQRALDLEPGYVQAHADLARAYICLANDKFPDYFEKARTEVSTALRLDDSNASAHGLLAYGLWLKDWDFKGAEREFQRTIELNPNASEERRKGYARVLSVMGRHDEAVRQIEIVEKLDPLSLVVKADVGYIYKDARQYDLALQKFRGVVEMQPSNYPARFGLAEVYTYTGRYDEALAEVNKLKRPDNSVDDAVMYAGWIHAMAGQTDEARKILAECEPNPHISPVLIASTYTALGDRDRAFDWLEKAYERHDQDFMQAIKASPVYDKLRDDPRYNKIIAKMGL